MLRKLSSLQKNIDKEGSILDIKDLVASYLKSLSKELSEYGRVYPSNCEDTIRTLLSKYEED